MTDEPVDEGQKDPFSELSAADILPEEFRGRDPAEVRLMLNQMPRIVKAQKEELESLRLQVGGAGRPDVTHGPVEVQKTPEELQQEFEELFEANPREAIRKFVEVEYGPRFGQVESRVGEAEFRLVKQSVPDFGEYEEEIRLLLQQSGVPATQQNIMGAYTMAVGNREIQKRQQRLRMAEESPKASPSPSELEEKVELTDLEQEVASSMGLSNEEFARYSQKDSFSLNIRT